MKHINLSSPALIACVIATSCLAAPQTMRASSAAVTITVTRSDDPQPTSLSKTCSFTSGALSAATDGCSFRRAVLEAAARPQSDRPITIQFALALTDTNKDLVAPGTWTIKLTDALPPLRTDSIINRNGAVTIDGATQAGGRANAPAILIDLANNSWSIESANNIFRNLSIKKSGGLLFKTGASGNLVERSWMGLTDDGQGLDLRTPAAPGNLAIGNGVRMLSGSDNNIVRLNRFMGSTTPAIDIESGTTGNIVISNSIGLRSDGTAPVIPDPVRCQKLVDFDPNSWYGGRGIRISGTANRVEANVIAGLHLQLSGTELESPGIEVLGADHEVTRNVIGVDLANTQIGICGQAMKVAGNGSPDHKQYNRRRGRGRSGDGWWRSGHHGQ